MVAVVEQAEPSQSQRAPEGRRSGSAAARTERERPELLAGMYAAPHGVGVLSEMTGELPRYDGRYVTIKDQWSRGEIGAGTLCWREDRLRVSRLPRTLNEGAGVEIDPPRWAA